MAGSGGGLGGVEKNVEKKKRGIMMIGVEEHVQKARQAKHPRARVRSGAGASSSARQGGGSRKAHLNHASREKYTEQQEERRRAHFGLHSNVEEYEKLERSILGLCVLAGKEAEGTYRQERAESKAPILPHSFKSAFEYIKCMLPLLLDEGRASVLKEAEEAIARGRAVRLKCEDHFSHVTDGYFMLKFGEVEAELEEGEERISRNRMEAWSEGEYLLIADGDINNAKNTTIREWAADARATVVGGVVQTIVRRGQGDGYIIVRIPALFNSTSDVDSGRAIYSKMVKAIMGREAFCVPCGNFTTTKREFKALLGSSTQLCTAFPELLKPIEIDYGKQQVPDLPQMSCFSERFASHLHKMFNKNQRYAIHYAAAHMDLLTKKNPLDGQQSKFTLVQGPPGTGKTHCVLGMLNVIHLVCIQRYYSNFLASVMTHAEPRVARPRILICAPSNAAIDEVMIRIMTERFIDGDGRQYCPRVCRIGSVKRGPEDSRVPKEKDLILGVSIESQIEELLGTSRQALRNRIGKLNATMEENTQHLHRAQQLIRMQKKSEGKDSLDRRVIEVSELLLKQRRELQRLEIAIHYAPTTARRDRKNLETLFAEDAELVFSTLSSATRNILAKSEQQFETVLIDEAAQACEVACLQALNYIPRHVVLVGDPKQLPATVLSQRALRHQYDRSLFERLQMAGTGVLRLTTQYRMHPQIRCFPSKQFYDNSLIDSESVQNQPEEAWYSDKFLKPFAFFDSKGLESRDNGVGGSIRNVNEARFCVALLERLINVHTRAKKSHYPTCAIITPYRAQKSELERQIAQETRTYNMRNVVKVSTIDSFQGQESDVIIFSSVRSDTVGFVADARRMNVALTRAKRSLWVVGNAAVLQRADGGHWGALIDHAKECRSLFSATLEQIHGR